MVNRGVWRKDLALFVSAWNPAKSLSKNTMSFFLRDVISSAVDSESLFLGSIRSEFRGMTTSVAFHKND